MALITVSIGIFGVQAILGESHFCTTLYMILESNKDFLKYIRMQIKCGVYF